LAWLADAIEVRLRRSKDFGLTYLPTQTPDIPIALILTESLIDPFATAEGTEERSLALGVIYYGS
jgi:hypothetical protein